MTDFTLTNWYLATGEGMTQWLMYMRAENEQVVLAEFARREGEYFATGAKVTPGFDFECPEAQLFLTSGIRKIIAAKDYGNVVFFASFHVNYS